MGKSEEIKKLEVKANKMMREFCGKINPEDANMLKEILELIVEINALKTNI